MGRIGLAAHYSHQGLRVFAEVEMLSRLHPNGICTEEHSCCLINELIPNGSVESLPDAQSSLTYFRTRTSPNAASHKFPSKPKRAIPAVLHTLHLQLQTQKFWHKKVVIKPNFFGNKYDVLYVRYPGLPPSPRMSPSNITIEDGPLMTGGHGRAIKPLGVDVRK